MPTSYIHSTLTRNALALTNCIPGDHSALIETYCLYPDRYFGGDDESVPYNFFTDGVQFHYLPDTPLISLYRYWSAEGGRIHRTKPFLNENFIHAKAGFEFFLTNIIEQFRAGNWENGKKYLGSLLHMLQDSTYGLHSFEGPAGMDLFVLDRLMDSEEQPTMMATKIDIQGKDRPASPYTPCVLGGTIGEVVMRLYREYYRRTCEARKCSFQYILNIRDKKEAENLVLVQQLIDIASQLCADVIVTVVRLADGTAPVAPQRSLTEFEPYEFPFGGHGSYRFRSFERDRVIFADGTAKTIDGVSFGSHYEGALRYWIAPGLYRKFTTTLKLYAPANSSGDAQIQIRNHGQLVLTVVLDAQNTEVELTIADPGDEFSFEMISKPLCGVIALENPIFFY